MRILYYAELDPFAGIGQTVDDFRAARSEVALSCLLHDVVVVQPDNLLEHSLTLPLFEHMAPFVRAGQLTTSADARAAPPHEYLHGRVEQALARAARVRGRDRATRRRELDDLRRRYAAILPRRWIVSRSVRAQVGLFGERMRTYLAEAPRAGWVDRRLLGWVDAGLDAGVRVDRDFMFAHLARLRDSASPRELARVAAFAQALLLEGGALGHAADPTARDGRCLIYPGRFAARLTADDPRRAGLAAPPFAVQTWPVAARRRLEAIGVSLDALLVLPPSELLEVASSAEWICVRSEAEVPAEVRAELRARFAETRDVRDALPAAAALLPAGPRSLGARLPAPWHLAAQAVLITSLPAERAGELVLDLVRLELRRDGDTARLTKAEAELCVAIAIAGTAGLPIHHWKQLKADVDQMAAAGPEDRLLAWRSQQDEAFQRDVDRRRLLEVTKSHANRALSLVGVAISARRGRLSLVDLARAEPPIVPRLAGTLWDLLGAPADTPPPPALSPAEGRLYLALAAASPAWLPVRALASTLEKPDDDGGVKQTVDALGKLARRLIATRAPVRVCRVRRGLYALVPALATGGDVR